MTSEISEKPKDRTDDELVGILCAVRCGTITLGRQVPENMLLNVFMPLIFIMGDEKASAEFSEKCASGQIYEIYGEDDGRGHFVNGFPAFMAFKSLNRSEFGRMVKINEERKIVPMGEKNPEAQANRGEGKP